MNEGRADLGSGIDRDLMGGFGSVRDCGPATVIKHNVCAEDQRVTFAEHSYVVVVCVLIRSEFRWFVALGVELEAGASWS